MKTGKKIVSMLLVLAFVILMIPSFDLGIRAEQADAATGLYRFKAGDVAVINQAKIDDIVEDTKDDPKFANFASQPSFVIENGVYSVTVQGPITYNGKDVTVSIVFGTENNEGGYDGVTIDRTNETVSSNNSANARVGDIKSGGYADLSDLYEAGKALGWPNNYVPTTPFLITDGAKVKTLFLGDCELRAGLNRVHVNKSGTDQNPTYQWAVENDRCGYAGIQVGRDCSLEIIDVVGGQLSVYGGYQLAGNHNSYTASKTIDDYIYANTTFQGSYIYPSIKINNTTYTADSYRAGGAGIGGGANYDTTSSGYSDYPYGTPGEIVINGGTIYAIGGHLGAAIGGGVNGASTTSKIEINGGNITAVGGRFSTAIGDGDSFNGGPANDFLNSAKIIINGGNLRIYGGTSAAAIGTTDEVSHSKGFGVNALSGLTIEINGGVIEAQSGQATSNTSKTAAIGSGENTNMKDNSITIYSNATVFARSFSEYAISNKGTSSDVPMVNIDPEGFVYLARFSSADYERALTLYPVYKDALGNPVAVKEAAYETLDTQGEPDEYYAVEEEMVGEALVKILYKVKKIEKQDGTVVFEPELDGENRIFLTNTQGQSVNFSYYYDISAGKEFVVPTSYKAVALSLQSGDYVFHVPMGGSNDKSLTNDIYAHFSKHLNGTTSASINDGTKNAYYHFTYGTNQIKSETPHVTLDETAFALTTLQVVAAGQEMLTGSNAFNPTVLGYTIYIPNDATSFDLSFVYKYTEGNQTTRQFILNFENLKTSDGQTKKTYDIKNNGQTEIELDKIVFTNEKEDKGYIWINKIDQSSKGNPSLTYKITVIRRPKYYIHINAISKKYDGEPVSPEIVKITEDRGTGYIDKTEVHYAYGDVPAEYGTHDSVHFPDDYDPADGTYQAAYAQKAVFDNREVTVEYAIVPNQTETAVSLITRFSYIDDSGRLVQKRSTVNINMDEEELVFTLDESSDHVLMPSDLGGYKIETSLNVANAENTFLWTVYVSYYEGSTTNPVKTPVLRVTVDEQVEETPANQLPQVSGDGKKVHASEETAKAQALADAQAALEHNIWETRYSDSYFYAAGTDKTETFKMVVKHPLNPTLDSKDPSEDGFVYRIVDTYQYRYHKFHYYYEVLPEGEEIPFTKEQLEEILASCTYYADPSGDGILTPEHQKLDGPPSDAGDYILKMEYVSEKYEAYSAIAFEIRKRPIQIVGVSNWITYMDEDTIRILQSVDQPTHLKTYPLNPGIGNNTYLYGTAYFDDVVDGDVVQLSPNVYAYYNEITISHNEKKITLRYDYITEYDSKTEKYTVVKGRQIDWLTDLAGAKDDSGNYLNDNRNYELTGVANFDATADNTTDGFSFVHVPGALAFTARGTIFKQSYYTEAENEAIWRKFWPAWSEEYLKWDESESGARDDLGNYITPHLMEENIGYQSPSNASHQDYVYLRTLNANRGATYSVDIEFADEIVFQYAKAVWDVNTHQYVEGEASYWSGNNGVNNLIRIINRSDEAVTYTATYYKHAVFGMSLEMGFSDTYDGSGEIVETMSAQLAPAVGAYQQALLTDEELMPLDAVDTEARFYIIVRGRPLNTTKTAVGSITLTITSVGHQDP